MFKLFREYIIGGRTGKRESAWFLFSLWLAWTLWLTYAAVSLGRDIEVVVGMWSLVTPFVWGWMFISHGMEWGSVQTTLLNRAAAPRAAAVSPAQADAALDPVAPSANREAG